MKDQRNGNIFSIIAGILLIVPILYNAVTMHIGTFSVVFIVWTLKVILGVLLIIGRKNVGLPIISGLCLLFDIYDFTQTFRIAGFYMFSLLDCLVSLLLFLLFLFNCLPELKKQAEAANKIWFIPALLYLVSTVMYIARSMNSMDPRNLITLAVRDLLYIAALFFSMYWLYVTYREDKQSAQYEKASPTAYTAAAGVGISPFGDMTSADEGGILAEASYVTEPKPGWIRDIFGVFVSLVLIFGGASGTLVLRGTNSSTALVVVGIGFLIWDIVSVVMKSSALKKSEALWQSTRERMTALEGRYLSVGQPISEIPLKNVRVACGGVPGALIFDPRLNGGAMAYNKESKEYVSSTTRSLNVLTFEHLDTGAAFEITDEIRSDFIFSVSIKDGKYAVSLPEGVRVIEKMAEPPKEADIQT